MPNQFSQRVQQKIVKLFLSAGVEAVKPILPEFKNTYGEGSHRLYLDILPGSKGLMDKPRQLTDRAKLD